MKFNNACKKSVLEQFPNMTYNALCSLVVELVTAYPLFTLYA